MHLRHLNLSVEDLTEAQDFFRDFFGFRLLERKGNAIAVLTDADQFVLVLSDPRKFGSEAPIRYPEMFHVGFYFQTAAEVDQLYARFAVAPNVQVSDEPKMIRGAYTFYVTALSAIMFEVTHRPEQTGVGA